MSFFLNRRRPVVSQVVEALRQLQNDPERLSYERERRYNEPPPPYSESGETTQPPTPGPAEPPVVDDFYERQEKRIALFKSTPYNQFQSQVKREGERLEYQLIHARSGRRQTLSWDMSLDLKSNPENNVRSRWVEQGIWGDEWGPAWPKGSCPMSWKVTSEGGPFWGPYSAHESDCFPGGRWGHEEYSPELEFETDSESESEQELGLFGSIPPRPKPQQPRPRRRRPLPKKEGPIPSWLIPKPTVRNPEASRPYHQFLYQISKEREWIVDEIDYKARGTAVDLDALAYHSVKDNWIQDGIWNPKWDDLPGMKWLYEEVEGQLNEHGVLDTPAADDATVEPSHETVDDSGRETRCSPPPNPFAPTPIPNGANSHSDDSSPPTPTNAEASIAETSSAGHPAVTTSVEATQHIPQRSSCKRSRATDAVEDPQPKRLRRNRQDSALLCDVSDAPDAEKPKPQKSRAIITRARAKVKTLPGDEAAVLTRSRKRRDRIESVSSPPRRSARIAEGGKKRAANAAATPSSRPPRTKTTKKAHFK